jgi:hypothetical protein
MLNLRKHMIDYFVETLATAYRRTYGELEPAICNTIVWAGRLALENIANSDALYHNVEHTMLVTAVGQSILEGKHLCEGGIAPHDWMHVTVALLFHDIGYVRGICRRDSEGAVATGVADETVAFNVAGTDSSLTPYHVDRSKQFIYERFGGELVGGVRLNANLIASYIEMTRFPVPDGDQYRDTAGYGGLIRAADFIGQLGDPDYLRKAPALFYEFEELGTNKRYGYEKPGDLRAMFAPFYWRVVSPYIQDALRYLFLTQEGKEWMANLYAQVFASEHGSKR